MLLLKFHEVGAVALIIQVPSVTASRLNLLGVLRVLVFLLGIDIERHLFFEFYLLLVLFLLFHLSVS